jgi:serine/threonine-protein kinase
VYAAGVILFEMIAGQRPFEGEVAEMLRRRALEPAPRLSKVRPELSVSSELDDCVALALARDKVARYPDAAAFGAAIDALPGTTAFGAAITTPDAATEIDVSLRSLVAPAAARPPPPPPRRAPTRWLVSAAIATVGIVALAVVQPWNEPPPAEEPRLHRGDAVFVRATADAGPPDAPAPDAPAARPRPPPDPWASDVPGELAVLRDRLGDGEPSEAYLQRVAGYVRNHPAEVRGVLLLAHGYAARGWLTLALDRYTEAYALDPLSRGDPRMLSTLIRLSSSPAIGEDAEQMVVDLYGREALEAVIAARAASADRNELSRFTELRDRLAALP